MDVGVRASDACVDSSALPKSVSRVVGSGSWMYVLVEPFAGYVPTVFCFMCE